LQSEDGERERLATALQAEQATVRDLKLCVEAQKNELDQLKADRESERMPRLQQQQLIEENQRLRSDAADLDELQAQLEQTQSELNARRRSDHRGSQNSLKKFH
jgi:hypothetical protein